MKSLDRFTFGDVLVDADVFVARTATEALPAGNSRPVMLKIYTVADRNDRSTEARYSNELRVMSQIGSAHHVSALYSAGTLEKSLWLALSPATMSALALISDVGGDPNAVSQLIEHAALGLEAIHRHGILHNDLKPGNLLATPDGWIVSDLSLAGPPTAEVTQHADMVRFAAPEVFSREFGKLSPSTDLYALGHIAYELALGTRLWRSQFPQVYDPGWRPKDGVNPAKWMAWHCSTQTKPPVIQEVIKSFPPALGDFVAKLMTKDPAQRFASAGAVAKAIGELSNAPAPQPVSAPAGARNVPPPAPRAQQAAPKAPAAPAGTPQAPAAKPGSSSAPDAVAPGGPTFYVRMRNKQSGPFDLATLQRHARSGLISRLHQISPDGINWRPSTSLEGLFPS